MHKLPQEAMRFKPTPEMIGEMLFRKSKSPHNPTFREKCRAMKAVGHFMVSLPTLTIATRDRIEQEMLARQRADQNRAGYEIAAASALSPETLDG